MCVWGGGGVGGGGGVEMGLVSRVISFRIRRNIVGSDDVLVIRQFKMQKREFIC